MGLLCSLVFQPVIRFIQVIVAVLVNVLKMICTIIQELVSVLKQVLKYVCNTVVQTVCGAVCGVVCGICDFFCGIFGCDCHCENVCHDVCNTVTQLVCGWTYVLESVLEWVTRLICNYIVQAIIVLLHLIEAIVTMVLTWVCSLIDFVIRWFLCWTYIAELLDRVTGGETPRSFRVSPRIVPNAAGYSDWFVYVNTPDANGNVDQNSQLYILSDEGRPLLPVVDRESGNISYVEVLTRENVIMGMLRRADRKEGGYVTGRPFLYYPYKVIEIASHLFGDVFASDPADDGTGTDFHRNLFTYQPNVQAWLGGDGKLADNNYNNWNGKYTSPSASDYFGDRSLPDFGLRVDTDETCSRGTNTFLNLANGGIQLTPPNTAVAETMTCGAGQSLTFDQTNFLMLNKADATSVTTYLVSQYDPDESSVGCNELLGYTIVTFEGSGSLTIPLLVFLGAQTAAALVFLLIRLVVTGSMAMQKINTSYAANFDLSIGKLVTSFVKWGGWVLHEFPYLLVIVLFLLAWAIFRGETHGSFFERFPQPTLLVGAGIWMAAWFLFYLPWRFTVAYYLLPFAIGSSIVCGVVVGEAIQSLSRGATAPVKILSHKNLSLAGRTATWFGLFIVLLLFLGSLVNNATNARLQLAVDDANAAMLRYVAIHAPPESRVLLNLSPQSEYSVEIGQHLRLIYLRPDLQVAVLTAKSLAEAAASQDPYLLVSPELTNQLIHQTTCTKLQVGFCQVMGTHPNAQSRCNAFRTGRRANLVLVIFPIE